MQVDEGHFKAPPVQAYAGHPTVSEDDKHSDAAAPSTSASIPWVATADLPELDQRYRDYVSRRKSLVSISVSNLVPSSTRASLDTVAEDEAKVSLLDTKSGVVLTSSGADDATLRDKQTDQSSVAPPGSALANLDLAAVESKLAELRADKVLAAQVPFEDNLYSDLTVRTFFASTFYLLLVLLCARFFPPWSAILGPTLTLWVGHRAHIAASHIPAEPASLSTANAPTTVAVSNSSVPSSTPEQAS